MKLKNKVALITGSSSNIGEATAKLFALEGAKVVINCKTNEAGAARVTQEIIQAGGQAFYVKADVSQEEQAKNLFDQILNKWHAIDILINNAGHGHDKDILESTQADWQHALDDCLMSTVFCSKYAGRIMLKQKSGTIINTSSICGALNAGQPSIIAYSAAKAAVLSLTNTLAKRYAPHITVNAVIPGYVYKHKWDSLPKEAVTQLLDSTLLKRFVTVDEIAQTFLFIATNRAITGQSIVVDAGFLIKQE